VKVIPGSTRDADRAGVLVAFDEEVALIERRGGGRNYWVAPRGGVEPAENPEAAAAREAFEELGLRVDIHRKVLELHGLHPTGRVQHYFLASCPEREFGDMTGPELSSPSNAYLPRWVHLRDVEALNVLPDELREFLAGVARTGWPDEVLVIGGD
jgi:8-oxo-dGTP diphosphatase